MWSSPNDSRTVLRAVVHARPGIGPMLLETFDQESCRLSEGLFVAAIEIDNLHVGAPSLQPLQREHDGGHPTGTHYLAAPDQAENILHGHPYNLHELVLVGVRRRGLLDAAGEEEVGPIVLEARGGG